MLFIGWSLVVLASAFQMSSLPEEKEKRVACSGVPRIESKSVVGSTKWLRLETLTYQDEKGKSRAWDLCTRTTKSSPDSIDAVVIVALLKKSGSPTVETLLVEQYRPPVGRSTIEFPAGLMDKGESPETAALRELREETGFVGERCSVVPQVSRGVCMSPGLTDESVHIVLVEVDLENPYNVEPQAEPDEGEHIVVKRVELKKGLTQVLEDGHAMPIQGLYLFAMGLELGLDFGQKATESESSTN